MRRTTSSQEQAWGPPLDPMQASYRRSVVGKRNESDEPEDIWAREHEFELIGMSDEDASDLIAAAGFRPFVFDAGSGQVLALLKAVNTVTVISVDGVVRRVRR